MYLFIYVNKHIKADFLSFHYVLLPTKSEAKNQASCGSDLHLTTKSSDSQRIRPLKLDTKNPAQNLDSRY